MPYSLCDMDCDQEINKSDIEEHCSDCLCVGGLEGSDQQDMPATKAWRPTSVVEERDRLKTLSIELDKLLSDWLNGSVSVKVEVSSVKNLEITKSSESSPDFFTSRETFSWIESLRSVATKTGNLYRINNENN